MPNPSGALWQIATKRCVVTPLTAAPPYRVSVFDGDLVTVEREFATHDAAVEDAIAELRAATGALLGT
jgi:hypothetical protein